MEAVLTPTEMADADAATIAAGTPASVLMDRAGRAVAWRVREVLGGVYGRRVVVVCGTGNNGGDGRIAARVLRGWGVRVDVFDLESGIDESVFARAVARADLLIDAMLGTGSRGALSGAAARVARASLDVPTLAVDLPSGVDPLTGAVDGDAVHAAWTVTFGARKTGCCFEPGRSHSGDLTVADIGIGVDHGPITALTTAADVREWWRPDDPETHKWRAGLLVVGGSGGMTGAPRLVSHAAMRTGARLVWCAVPGAEAAAATGGSEVIAKALPATADGALEGIGEEVQAAIGRFAAAVVGPGLGLADATRVAVRALVAEAKLPLVLDADGCTAFAGDAEALRSRPAPTVLTPHAGEYERLMGEPVGSDRVAAARRLAERSGCVTLLKGPGSVVAHPSGPVAINSVDGPWLATAGSGDVLSGIIGGLLARGLGPFEAAAAGALVHGLAAEVAGHTGLQAGDLVAALPETLTRLLHATTPSAEMPTRPEL